MPNDLRNFLKKCEVESPKCDASSGVPIFASNLESMNSSTRRQTRGGKTLQSLEFVPVPLSEPSVSIRGREGRRTRSSYFVRVSPKAGGVTSTDHGAASAAPGSLRDRSP